MVVYLERQVSAAAVWARRLAVFSAVLLATAGLGHRFGLVESNGFIGVLGVVAALAVLSLLLSALGFARVWSHGDIGGRSITVAVIVSLVVLAPFVFTAYLAATYPMLTDISTDLDDPPDLTMATAARTADMNPIVAPTYETRQLQLEAYPLVTGRRYDAPFARVVEAVQKIVNDRGWRIVSPRPGALDVVSEVTVEAVARTFVFAFPVDVAVRVTDEDASTYVDMRSASRFGFHDLGDNAARINDFLDTLDAEVSALAGVAPDPVEPDELDPPTPEPRPEN